MAVGVPFYPSEKDDDNTKEKTISNTKKSIFQGNGIVLGEWPQTIKADDVAISNKIDNRGYYLGSDGAYYAKLVAKPYYDGYSFSNKSPVKKNNTYYFKVEPLLWNIVKKENNRYLLHSKKIIFNMAFQSNYHLDEDGDIVTDFNGAPEETYANNYIYSCIRNWLTNKFMLCFSENIDMNCNSVKILPYVIFDHLSIKDSVFLLSKNEIEKYGVGSYKVHMRSATDYAIANGTYVFGVNSKGKKSRATGKGWWWLRTPCDSEGQDTVCAIDQNGVTNYTWIWVNGYGIVPAIYIEAFE